VTRRRLVLGLVLAAAAAVGIAVWTGGDGDQPTSRPSPVPSDREVTTGAALATHPGRIVGYVRDVNGRPVPGARVALSDGRAIVRAGPSGRYALRARPGRWTVIARHPSYTRQSVATAVSRRGGARVDFALAVTAPRRVSIGNSADRVLMWTGCDDVVRLGERELRRWIGRGVDGFVCQAQHLRGLGGTQAFTGDPRARLRGKEYDLQRRLRDSVAVRWARRGRLLLYLGFYAVNHFNERTPLADWFDDRRWSRTVLPQVGDIAAAARSMGFAGIAVDQELYPQQGGELRASWSVRYPGNHHSEEEVRTKVKERGRQLMERMVRAYPGLEVVAYDTRLPDTWQAKVTAEVNDLPGESDDDVRIDLWDGLLSVQGYSAIRWMDAVFHKTVHLFNASWDTALEYNANQTYSLLSRSVSNWSYASSRLHVSPFSWIDEGPGDFASARDPDYVAEQLDAFKRWGAGGSFANYAYDALDAFDYGPYDDGLRRASSPARVDHDPPELRLSAPTGTPRVAAGETVTLRGVADDDFAIRAVRWYDDRGREGVARLTWEFNGDQRSGWKGEMRWTIENLTISQDAGHITISAEDIHGLARQLRLAVR
jgi:hypothetical protein